MSAADPAAAPPAIERPPRPGPLATVLHVTLLSVQRGMRGKRLLVALLFVAVPSLLSILISHLGAPPGHQEEFFYSMLSVFHLPIVIPAVALTLATAFPWPEAEEGTLTYWFTAPVWRWAIHLGRFLGAMIIGSLVLPISFLGTYMPLVPPEGQDLWPTAFQAILVTWLAFPAYLAIFGLLATVFRRGVILGVVFVVIENFTAIVPGNIQKLTVVFYERAFLWQHVPEHMRSVVDEAFILNRKTFATEAADAMVVFLTVPVLALALSLVFIHLIEFRAKQGHSA